MASPTPEVSHGRGGAGNINPDDTTYVDGEVVRVGIEGSHGDGAFSTGRGGLGNIGDSKTPPPGGPRADKVLIPDAAIRASADHQDRHIGRGGAGNELRATPEAGGHKEEEGEGAAAPVSLVDKVKEKLFGGFRKN